MKYTVRSFSVGLLAAGLIMLIVYYFFEDSSNEQISISTDEMISQLEEEGYRVLTETEYISYSVANTQQNEDEESDEDASVEEEEDTEENANETTEEDEEVADTEEENTEDQNEEEVVEEEEEDNTPSSVTINIPSGMASLDLSYLLEEENLIDDAEEFNIYLQQNGYALRLQLGEHELTSDMSEQEIAETIAN